MIKRKSAGIPLVSVILPTYNRANLIARSIKSVLSQSFVDFELLVIDDASTDATAEVVQRFDDHRIRYVRLDRNGGAGAARNKGIELSRADFIAFQDSDDEWLPEKLEKHMRIFSEEPPAYSIVYSDMLTVFADGSTEYHHSPEIIRSQILNPQSKFYQVYMLGIQSAVIRKSCFDKVGTFREEITCLQDMELFIRLALDFDFYHIQEPLVRYHKTEGLTSHFFYQLQDRKLLLKMYSAELKLHPGYIVKEFIETNCSLLSRKGRAVVERLINRLLFKK